MAKLKPGDIVNCRLRASVIVSPYEEYDESKTFAIVATDDNGYYLFVPRYYSVKGALVANAYSCKSLGIDPKYIDEDIVYISENTVASIESQQDGLKCDVCREFYPYAEANTDSGVFVCYACKHSPYH